MDNQTINFNFPSRQIPPQPWILSLSVFSFWGFCAYALSVGLPAFAITTETAPALSRISNLELPVTERVTPQRSQEYWAEIPALPTRKMPRTTQGGATRSGVTPKFKYSPPANLPLRERPMATGGAGTRSLEIFVELLTPYNHTGLTAEAHPTLVWFMSDVPNAPLELTIRNEATSAVLFQKRLVVKEPGIMSYALPANAPPLNPGIEYRWSLTLTQDESPVIYQSWIQRQTLTPEQTQVIHATPSGSARAEFYAAEGFWYDAVAQVTTDFLGNPDLMSAQENLLGLLAQVELDQIVDLEPGAFVVDLSAMNSLTVAPTPKAITPTVVPHSGSRSR